VTEDTKDNIARIGLLTFVVVCFLVSASTGWAGPLDEPRCCFTPYRDLDGTIHRSTTVLTYFKKAHPCPATSLSTGACPGWIMDHVVPLACGGIDAVENLQWLPTDMWKMKSLWERKIYGGHNISAGCP